MAPHRLSILSLAILLATLPSETAILQVAAHMQLTSPPPLRSTHNPHTGPLPDYSMTTPLSSDGSNFPCKGYLSLLGTPQGASVATWPAGSTQHMTISGGAVHGGGSCQASLSVDAGQTWHVLHSYIGACPAINGDSSFSFRVPGDVPETKGAVFSWTWFNNLGNREMYQNCAVVDITGGRSGDDFGQRPAMFVADVGNGCTTVDSRDVLFPDPGPDLDVNDGGKAVPAKGDGCQRGMGGMAGGGGRGGDSGSGGGSSDDGDSNGNDGMGDGMSGDGSGNGGGSSSGTSSGGYNSGGGRHPSPTNTWVPSAGTWTPGDDWPNGYGSVAATSRGGGLVAVGAFASILLGLLI
ncbi:hypothetical protein B0H66DRAFT_530037 [Apodospora peruviana]|uniref:Lytic polysaccharide monooxygenase n=1 Tax=Apodospora peruviana TaxID=516989 RepID=A0AAE0IJC8_9PEZI|nr:hypothetical protein B0H66DRAFT_530037 [Apodospora peruviana]